MIIQEYLNFLNEKDDIHPKSKEVLSWFAATPASDVAVGLATGASQYRKGKALGTAGTTIAKEVGLHAAKGAALSIAAYAAYRYIRSIFDKCTKKCGTIAINTPKRQLCLLQCKYESQINQLRLLKKHKASKEEINKLINNINNTRIKIKKYQQYLKLK